MISFIKQVHFLKLLPLILLVLNLSCSKSDDSPDPKTFQYRIKEQKNSSGNATKYEYNNQNLVTKIEYPSGGSETYLYNNAGFLTNKIQTDNSFWSYLRDVNGRLLEEIYAYNGNPKTKIIYVYDATGKVIEEKNYVYDNDDYNSSYSVFLYYNAKNELIQKITPQHTPYGTNTSLTFENSEEYQYDERGNQNVFVLKESRVANGNLQKVYEYKYKFDNIKPAYYPNSTLFKNNPIEVTTIQYTINENIQNQYTITVTNTYNEAGYITKTDASFLGSRTFTLEKIN
jgi:hypothetical protein